MKHKLNRLFALVLAVTMAFSMVLVPVSASTAFTDVSENAWYTEAVEYVAERGWMSGVSTTSFDPKGDVTRAMFVTVLARVAGVEVDNSNPVFTDTPVGKWYTGAAAWAYQKGIVSGVGNNRFNPNAKITRQDMATMMGKFLLSEGYYLTNESEYSFSDIMSASSYARAGIERCAANGLLSGMPDGTFAPKQIATRAQLAVILMKLGTIADTSAELAKANPAQTLAAEAEGMTVEVNAPDYALPADSEMTLALVTDEAAIESMSEKVNAEIVAAAEVTFLNDGEAVSPNTSLTVRFALDGVEDPESVRVFYMRNDGTVEFVLSEVISVSRDGNRKGFDVAVGDDFSYDGIFIFATRYDNWNDKYFFVVHSATGLVEAIKYWQNDGNGGGYYLYNTYDLTTHISDGCLYGGYYGDCAGIDRTVLATYLNTVDFPGGNGWENVNNSNNLYRRYLNDISGDTYHFNCYTVNSALYYWDSVSAGKIENGNENGKNITPKPGYIYFVKEVPAAYQNTKRIIVADGVNEAMYLVSALDDYNYSDARFTVKDGSGAVLTPAPYQFYTPALKIYNFDGTEHPIAGTEDNIYRPNNFSNGVFNKGLLYVAHIADLTEESYTYTPQWTTLDGVTVTGSAQTEIISGVYIAPNTTMMFNLNRKTHNNDDWWDYTTNHYVYFEAAPGWGSEDQYVKIVDTDGIASTHDYSCIAPTGYYSRVVVFRLRSDLTTFDPEKAWIHVDAYPPGDMWAKSDYINLEKERFHLMEFHDYDDEDDSYEWR